MKKHAREEENPQNTVNIWTWEHPLPSMKNIEISRKNSASLFVMFIFSFHELKPVQHTFQPFYKLLFTGFIYFGLL